MVACGSFSHWAVCRWSGGESASAAINKPGEKHISSVLKRLLLKLWKCGRCLCMVTSTVLLFCKLMQSASLLTEDDQQYFKALYQLLGFVMRWGIKYRLSDLASHVYRYNTFSYIDVVWLQYMYITPQPRVHALKKELFQKLTSQYSCARNVPLDMSVSLFQVNQRHSQLVKQASNCLNACVL